MINEVTILAKIYVQDSKFTINLLGIHISSFRCHVNNICVSVFPGVSEASNGNKPLGVLHFEAVR